MTHDEAERSTAVEKYLLNELPSAARDEFEAHFFECAACAADLKATSAFIEAAKRELRYPAAQPPVKRRSWFAPAWGLPTVSCACAALLAIVVYQNVAVYPSIARTEAALDQPQIMPSLSLVGGERRGGAVAAIAVHRGAPFVVSLDVPTGEQFVRYACTLQSVTGTTLWHLDIPASAAKDTLEIRVPSAGLNSGEYSLVVQGSSDLATLSPVDLARYRFRLDNVP